MDEKELLLKKHYEEDNLRKLIKDKMKELHITQREMATKIGVYPQNMCGYLAGRSTLSLERLKIVTDTLGL